MVKFANLVAKTFSIAEPLAESICRAFEDGDLPYYLSDYCPSIATEIDVIGVWEIYDFLEAIAALAPKKKRVISALEKAGKLTDGVRNSIEFNSSSYELDDMIIPYRPNPRSKAQIALKKGLAELTDLIERQEEGSATVEEMAAPYVGKEATLKTADDVLTGVRDILAERFAYDETVRAMAREFCYEDGFFEVIPKNRKDPHFARYRDKFIPVHDLDKKDLLTLMAAEDAKEVRFKLGVQIFRITEVLRNHFLKNPDAAGFELICQTIDDAWERLLLPIVERDVKLRLRADAEKWAITVIASELDKKIAEKRGTGTVITVGFGAGTTLVCTAVSSEGRLLGATSEPISAKDQGKNADRLRKFVGRYRPTRYVIAADERAEEITKIISTIMNGPDFSADVAPIKPDGQAELAESEWMKKNYSDLDAAMQKVFALGVMHTRPFPLIPEIGSKFFDLHPMQKIVNQDHLSEVIRRKVARLALGQGIKPREISDSVFKQFSRIPASILAEIRNRDIKEPLRTKQDLQGITGMTDVLYRNIAGYITLGASVNPLDCTIVHPFYFNLLADAARQLGMSLEGIVVNPTALHSYSTDDFMTKLYIQKNLIDQLINGPKPAAQGGAPRGRLRFDELLEGMVVGGTVTNITPFGVFVNINSVCDGLIHISQLADAYVQSPEQVVSVGDRVNVRILKADSQKRRISLSMKGLGPIGPRVKPSQNQLSTLVDHFSNR